MRIGPPVNCIPAYIPPIPVVPLSPEVSKALIASGVFAHNPNEVLWKSAESAQAAPGKGLIQRAALPGGVWLQGYRAPQPDNPLLATFFDAGKQALPVLEQAGADPVADGVALLLASPAMLHAWRSPGRGKAENLILYGNNVVRLLKLANNFAHVPHADSSLEVVAGIFKLGEQVFLAAEEKTVKA